MSRQHEGDGLVLQMGFAELDGAPWSASYASSRQPLRQTDGPDGHAQQPQISVFRSVDRDIFSCNMSPLLWTRTSSSTTSEVLSLNYGILASCLPQET